MANVLNALTLKDTKTGKTTDYEIQDTGARAQIAAQVAASTDENADYAAEVVDARVGAEGESYDSLGEAVRGQISALQYELREKLILNWEDGYINTSGTLVNPSSIRKEKYTIITCSKGDAFLFEYKFSSEKPECWTRITELDSEGKQISYTEIVPYISGSYFKKTYAVQNKNTCSIAISYRTYGITEYTNVSSYKLCEIDTIKSILKSLYELQDFDYEEYSGYINISGEVTLKNPYGEVYSENLYVTDGSTITIDGSYSIDRMAWVSIALYNKNGEFLSRPVIMNYPTVTNIHKTYQISNPDVSYIIISYRSYNEMHLKVQIEHNLYYKSVLNLNKVLSKKIENSATLNQNKNIKSINHRGYNTVAPENTLSAYKLSKKNGFDYVETDISFTSDGIPVCLHDSTVDRTSNGTGSIKNLTFEEVRAMDFGSWKSSDYEGETIPSFNEFILLCRNLGLHPYIELKSSDSYTEIQIKSLVDIVKYNGMSGKVTWISFNPTFLSYIKNYDSKARLGYVVNSITDSIITTTKSLKTDLNEVFIDVDYNSVTENSVNLCSSEEIPLEVWTVNTSSVLFSLNPYISGFTSDNLLCGKLLVSNNI